MLKWTCASQQNQMPQSMYHKNFIKQHTPCQLRTTAICNVTNYTLCSSLHLKHMQPFNKSQTCDQIMSQQYATNDFYQRNCQHLVQQCISFHLYCQHRRHVHQGLKQLHQLLREIQHFLIISPQISSTPETRCVIIN